MKRCILIIPVLFFLMNLGIAQSVEHSIDFGYKTLNTSCNVFATGIDVDGRTHQTTIGYPTFSGAPDYLLNLPCRRISQSSETGTEYQILFPFKKGYKYSINVQYSGTVSGANESYPQLALKLNITKKSQQSSTSCGTTQSISPAGYSGYAASGSGLAWASSPIISTGELDKDYESLSVASLPWPSSTSTGNQSIRVRKITITESITIVAPPSTGFEGKFYKNTLNGKMFVGMRGKYREITTRSAEVFANGLNLPFENVNADPPAVLLGVSFPSAALIPMTTGWEDPISLQVAFLYETSTGKWYLGEFTDYAPNPTWNLSTPLQLNFTELTSITSSTYNLKTVNSSTATANIYYHDSGAPGGYTTSPLILPIQVATLVNGDTNQLSNLAPNAYNLYDKIIYYNKLSNLTGN
jgi:hypothetical protein